MRYNMDLPVGFEEQVLRQRKNSSDLEKYAPRIENLDPIKAVSILGNVIETIVIARNLLHLPDDIPINLRWKKFQNEGTRKNLQGLSDLESKTQRNGFIKYSGLLSLNPEIIGKLSFWDTTALVAHEMYHLRKAFFLPSPSSTSSKPTSIQEHYSLREEIAADMFSLGYIAHYPQRGWIDKLKRFREILSLKLRIRDQKRYLRKLDSEIFSESA